MQRLGCYCKHKVVAVFYLAKFTQFGFILLPWQFTVAQTLKLYTVMSHTDSAKWEREVTTGILKGFDAQ